MRQQSDTSKSTSISIEFNGRTLRGNYRKAGSVLWVFHRLSFRTVAIASNESAELTAKRLLLEMATQSAASGGRSTYDYSMSSNEAIDSKRSRR